MILDNPYILSGPHAAHDPDRILYCMKRPAGYSLAGSGWSRYYASLEAAQRAFNRLYARGYSASVITHASNPKWCAYAVLVSRYAR